jgi:YD repeat-containing protein
MLRIGHARQASRRTISHNRRCRHAEKPRIEILEQRCLLASFTWAGGSSGDFGIAINWKDGNGNPGVPGIHDTATIGGSVTLGVSSVNAVSSLNAPQATLNVSGGGISVGVSGDSGGYSSIGMLNVSPGATFGVAGGSAGIDSDGGSIAGGINVAAGAYLTISSAGAATNINAGAAFTGSGTIYLTGYFNNVSVNADIIGPQNLAMDAGTVSVAGTFTIPGSFAWNGGVITGTGVTQIAHGATVTMAGSASKGLKSHMIRNAGSVVLSSGPFGFESTGAFDNLSGATFDIQVDTTIAQSTSSGGSFTNAAGATLKKTNGTGATTFLGLWFNNSGTVELGSGALYFDGGGTASGTFQTHAGTGIYFSGGRTYTLDHGATLAGSGWFGCVDDFSALTVNTDLTVEDLVLSPDHSTGLSGTGTVTVTHDLSWWSGEIEDHVIVTQAATFELEGSVSKVLQGGAIDNAGSATYSGSKLGLRGAFNNSGDFDDAADNDFQGGGTFNNLVGAKFTKSAGTNWTNFYPVVFNNAGTVNVESGSIYFDSGGTGTGTFQANAGAGLYFNGGGYHTLDHGATLAGPGQFGCVGDFSALTVNSNLSVQNFVLSADHSPGLSGTGVVTVTHDLTWQSGTISTRIVVESGATFELTGTISKVLNGGPIDNVGAATYSGTNLTLNGSFNNSGSFDDPAGNQIGGRGTFNNLAGATFSTNGVGSITRLSPALANSGVISVQGGTLQIFGASVTSNAGSIVVAQDAVLDLTGGQTVTYAGTFTGSGQGTVVLAGGTLNVGLGGATFNFPGAMFQWTGGSMELSAGDVINLGTINLSGSNQTQIYADGTLFDYGTIVQTGTGNFGLHSDNITPTTLMIEAGGSYLLESDAGINNLFYTNVIDNAGTIKKTGGTGTSTLAVIGQLINTGTIEADSGTLALAPTSFAQIASSVLTGGTWNALDGSTLTFPSGTAITGNGASITLGGSGAAITGISGLTSNSGNLSLTNGANFATTGDFSNSGSLSVGPGSAFNVSGNFVQTPNGTLNAAIGGSPAAGLYGKIVAGGTATLGGALNVALFNGYSPTFGQKYPVMSFASATGSFATITGLPSGMTATQAATKLNLAIAANAVDLVPASVTAPTSKTDGQSITVNWQVQNQSPNAVAGSWQDSVYLSAAPAITSNSILLGSAIHSGGVAANSAYSGSLTAALPALAPGNWFVLVDVDSHYQVADINRANNTLAATTGQLDVSVPALTLGAPLNDSFTSADQDHYYQVTVPAGGSLTIALTSSAASGAVALYVSQGTEPTPYSFQQAAVIPNQPNQTVTVPQVLSAGTYYILAHSVSGSAAAAGYTITATQTSSMAVSAIAPSSGGNAGNVTVEIDGTNFPPGAVASLTRGGETVAASTIDHVSASQLFATFNLAGAAAGSYTLSVQDGAESVSSPTPFQVMAASPGSLSVTLSTPQFVRAGRTGTVVITYSNPTADDMVAPLLTISSTNTTVFFSTPDDPNNYVPEAQVMAVAPSGPAGILRPGQSGQLNLTILSDDTVDDDTIPIQTYQIEAGQTINWNAQQTALQPSTVSTAAWKVIWSDLMAMVGTTTDSYNAALAQAATYLSGIGETSAEVSNVGRLWAFLESQADAAYPPAALDSTFDASLSSAGSLSLAIDRTFSSSISSRYKQSIFGPGWATSWQTSLSTDAFRNVTIDSGGTPGYFFKQPNGSYLDIAGEYGTLTGSGGSYTFTDTAGTQYVFRTSIQLDYEQDTDGNRITLGYNAENQLVALTYSNPSDPSQQAEQLTLTYQSGVVSQIADGTGDTWTYNYDATGHLQSVIAPGNLTTSYTYDTSTNPQTEGALLSVTYPDGSQANFTYDTQGRLSSISSNGGADPINLAYPGEAEVTATDTAGHQAAAWFNDLGLAARVEDPLGGFSNYLYDPSGNLVGYTDAAGSSYQYAYDGNGNLTQTVDPLGQTVRMTYGSLSNLTSITDAANNTTRYGYDAAGNLLNITYPDGTKQSFSYDPLGDMSQTVEQNGHPVSFQIQRPRPPHTGDLRRQVEPIVRLRRPRQPGDGQDIRRPGQPHRYHHPDLQCCQRIAFDQLSQRPVPRLQLQPDNQPAHSERRPGWFHG